MRRRHFIHTVSSSAAMAVLPCSYLERIMTAHELNADLVILGGGLGGCAAALAACRNGLNVILTEETDWLGGQISQQGVPPDEHKWIETHGAPASYRIYRDRVRDFYRRTYPLTKEASEREHLNPGDGAVSRLCHEPSVCVSVLMEMLIPYVSQGKLQILLNHKLTSASTDHERVVAVSLKDLYSERNRTITAPYFVDATELGDLLPLAEIEYITGSEAQKDTGELHAAAVADPNNNQAFTLCFAMDYVAEADHTIDMPKDYEKWRNYVPSLEPPWPGKLIDLTYANPQTLVAKELAFHPYGKTPAGILNLWKYRRIINQDNFQSGTYASDITVVNWPQNDFIPGNLIDVDQDTFKKVVADATQLNLSLLYWLQTEVPRPDGGAGWPGLRLRKDIMGTSDGMAKYPYIREARRIKAEFTVLEEHVGKEQRSMVAGSEKGKTCADFYDSIGTGYYHIDLHPSSGGNNYIDFPSLPFQIPLGALLPVRVDNVLPACKNIGTTHITNGCYRLHPVEWSIGEAVGMLVSFCKAKNAIPREVRSDAKKLAEFQQWIRTQGLETHWPAS